MTEFPRLLVYKASAGSGKTFTLAVQYIRLLIEDPFAYRHILAVTFTNKATAEMKARILEQLYGIANGLKSSESYLKVLESRTGYSEDRIRKASAEALRNLIHDYSRFRIETIDSFFQSVLRNLARELEIGANMSIELNNKEVLSDAVESMIEKLDRHSPILNWLLEFIYDRITDNQRWDNRSDIKQFGGNIFNEVYIEKGSKLRKKLAEPGFLASYRTQLNNLREEIIDQMKGFADQFFGVLESNGLLPNELYQGKSGVAGYFNKMSEGKISDGNLNSYVQKCLDNASGWHTKTSPKKDLIHSLAEAELMPLLTTAEKFRRKNIVLLNSCDISLKHLNQLQLLTSISEEVRISNRLNNRFLLVDTNALLHSLISEGDASFIYEKIGTAIDTVMIDEFQDTSRMQWENFHLLLEESLSQKEGSLIVGDIKQSIYRWRYGDWKILADIDKDPSLRVDEHTLGINRRSEARIVFFNNEIFTAACKILDERYQQETGMPCTQLTDAYKDVEQDTLKEEERGYVKISLLKNTAEHPYLTTVLEQMAEEVEHLISNGVRMTDIAILIRKNKYIPPIADFFEAHTPYRIVSDEAFRLEASLAICMMMDAIRVLIDPDDKIAAARLAVAYQQEILHSELTRDSILRSDIGQFLPEGFTSGIHSLRFMPLYELLETLFILFDMKKIEKQDAYLCAFYDAVTEYMQSNSSELSAFISYWDDTLHSKTIPSGEIEGIRILSIHKAKGLEYNTVLIPYCDWKVEDGHDNLIWCSADVEPFNELDIVPVTYEQKIAQSVFSDCYTDEKLQLWVDSLNLLYVAFTRACQNLIVWGKFEQKGTVADLLSLAIPRMKTIHMTSPHPDDADQGEIYEYGELQLIEEQKRRSSDNRLACLPESIPIHVESLETNIEFRQSNQSARFMGDDSDDKQQDYIRQGELLHRVFASVDEASDLPQAIDRLRFEGVIASAEQEEQIRKLAGWALKNPRVSSWYDGSWQLYNECSIIYCDANGIMQTKRPDRVMIKNDKVVVVDFKFGKKRDAYQDQVREYMNLLSEMGYTHIEGYLWYVFMNEIEEVNR